MNVVKQVFHPCDITNKTPKSFAKSEEMQHDNLKAPKLKLTQEAETLPSAAQLIALTAPFRSRQLVTCLSHHIRSTRTLRSRLFDPYFSEFMQQYSYHPWCANYTLGHTSYNQWRRRGRSRENIFEKGNTPTSGKLYS